MSRPREKGGWRPATIIPPALRFAALRAFLTVEALKGNDAALHLLRELRGQSGEVKA